jgi:hypothetical protein
MKYKQSLQPWTATLIFEDPKEKKKEIPHNFSKKIQDFIS